MLCVKIVSGAQDWQIFQRRGGAARVRLTGTYRLHRSCEDCRLDAARVLVRVMSETDNRPVVPWTAAQNISPSDASLHSGSWKTSLRVPQGGLYRIETALETKSESPQASRMFGGEMRLHLGVGDVFVIAGQSNAAGFGMDAAPDAPDLRVHLFRNREAWDLATHPMNESSGADDALNAEIGCCGTSPWLSFARSLADATGCPEGLVQTAMGGQSIDRWDERVNGDLMRNLLRRVRLAGGKAAGVLWYQGCTDAVPEKARRYEEQFAAVAARLHRALGNIPIFTMQLNRYLRADGDDASWGSVREAQRRAAQKHPGVYVLPTSDLPMSDYIHNSSCANVRLGLRAAQLCAQVLRHADGCAAPDLTEARGGARQVELKFSGATQGFVLLGEDAAKRAFTVMDGLGSEMEIAAVEAPEGVPGTLRLTLKRELPEHAFISFAWRCEPPACCVVDAVTRMPPLSFFGVPVKREGEV